jgi:hypothetical protein
MRESHGDATQHPLYSLCRIFAESGISYTLTRVLNLITTSTELEPQLLKCLFNVLVRLRHSDMLGWMLNMLELLRGLHHVQSYSDSREAAPKQSAKPTYFSHAISIRQNDGHRTRYCREDKPLHGSNAVIQSANGRPVPYNK